MEKLLEFAETLDGVYRALSPQPLTQPADYRKFYNPEVNLVRGDDQIALIALALSRASEGNWYKGFLMGHPGVGKSTEVTRLTEVIQKQFRVIRFSAIDDLDAAGFKPFDVLLVMMMKVVEQTREETGQEPSAKSLNAIRQWFSTEDITVTDGRNTEASASAGIGPKASPPLDIVLGLFATLKGEIKFTSARQSKRVEYRFNQLSSLLELVNETIYECNRLLKAHDGRQWLFVGEEFDKPGIPVAQTENLFLNYASIFHSLNAYLLFNIPISLVRSERRAQLPCSMDRVYCIPDTPVYDKHHQAHEAGRSALRDVLAKRMRPELFDAEQMTRLLVASGGNLRDLFSLVSRAADASILRDEADGIIRDPDATKAINILRSDYEQSLGQSPYDEDKAHEITYDQKAKRLVEIYSGDADAQIPDSILYSLLRARVVQQFNGTIWYGVHPLVVSILHRQNRLKANKEGKVPGGAD